MGDSANMVSETEREWLNDSRVKRDNQGYLARGALVFPRFWPGAESMENQPGELTQPSNEVGFVGLFLFKPGTIGCLGSLLDFLKIDRDDREYALFFNDPPCVAEEGYLRMIRIVSKRALKEIHGINRIEYGNEAIALDNFSIGQEVNVEDLILLFIAKEEERWGEGKAPGIFSCGCDCVKGGELQIGLMVENRDPFVLRVWSLIQMKPSPPDNPFACW
jgi:hypothetical protein